MNTPGGNTIAAAEHTFALLLALARRVPAAHRSLTEGRWERGKFVGWELRGKTLGLVGVGRIGIEVATRARAFQMRVVGFDPYISRAAALERGIELTDLDQLLAVADVVTLHLPLGEETRHIIDAKRIASMKRGAHLINCARGGLIDEAALLQALDSGQLASAALDVFEEEPKPSAALVGHPRLVATPHLGASTLEAQAAVGVQAANQALAVLLGTGVENAVNLPGPDYDGVPFKFRRR
jgi:D-3-phosphoglycerate dehydrogenase